MQKQPLPHPARRTPPAFSIRRCTFYLIIAALLMHMTIGSALAHTAMIHLA